MSCKQVLPRPEFTVISSIKRFIPAFILVILPKCPFCIMAYSGALSLCSGTKMYPHAGGWESVLIILIAAFIGLSILMNRRGVRTYIAFGVTVLGICSILISQYFFISQISYYLGVFLLFFGIWINGSFLYVYRRYLSSRFIEKLHL